jgi:hypothetical protein
MSCRLTALVAIPALALALGGCATGNPTAAPTTPTTSAGTSATAIPKTVPATSPQPAPAKSPAPAPTTRTRPRSPTAPKGKSLRPGVVTKVLVFIEENHSLSQMNAEMPYASGLARRFGYATRYTAIRHPSLPNYIAIAGGQAYGITNDDNPSNNPVDGQSVFGQAVAAGKTAAVYAAGMPERCATVNGGSRYAVKHNPWPYFIRERGACRRFDVPADKLPAAITTGSLPNVGMVIPNLCNDAHDCSLATADAWFKDQMTLVFSGPDWNSGHLAVVLTADEDDSSAGNKVLTIVIHPSQKSNVVTSPLNHYSLTRLYEEVARTSYLFRAASAPSMATAFGLPLS